MADNAKEAFDKASLGTENKAYDVIARLDPEYFEKLKGLYVDATFGRDGALPRKTKELIMVGITCALRAPRGVKIHSERALTLGATPAKYSKRWRSPRSLQACPACGWVSRPCRIFSRRRGRNSVEPAEWRDDVFETQRLFQNMLN